MSPYSIDKKYLLTESDVESKVIQPLITNDEPIGLGFDSTQIQTKVSLQKLKIDKGNKAVLYYPDFVIIIDGIPMIIIEAKKPDEDLDEAFRQACLYALEVNRKFKTDLNPCQLVIACDGIELLAGTWDNSTPHFRIGIDNWNTTDSDFSEFTNRFSLTRLSPIAKQLRKTIRTERAYKKPLNLIGGKQIQNQLTENSFGESISIQYRHLFNPNVEDERIDIVKNAYVKVVKHESHIAPIDRLIRKKIRPAIQESIEIEDNTAPDLLLDKIKNAHNYNNQVLLLIGSVGSGKSTFSTYLREVALNQTTLSHISWIKLDLNNAPVNKTEIYSWVKKNIIKQIQDSHPSVDFDDLSAIEKLYQDKIAGLKKGILKILNPESDKYKEILVNKLLEFQDDLDLTTISYINSFVHAHNKELVIVLDNCDKRSLEEQLLMFEVANWIKDNIKAIVFLPLRDTTFDHFRNEKPLDTVVKDLIFRINPPSLEKVIYNRIKYANRLSEKQNNNFYYLPNGFKVSYPSTDELYYLKSILRSLFQNKFFKSLIAGLTGSNIRRGIEIFLDFCKSGHISDKEIFRMKQSKGDFALPSHIISRVFLRGNRLYYTDSEAKVKNLFYSDISDDLPDPFVRVAILKWLHDRINQKGPSGIKGFHSVENLIHDLSKLGHSSDRVDQELLSLLKELLIISESQDTSRISKNELISIDTPGIIHIELIENIDYLSSCAEDLWYNTEALAMEVARNMAGEGKYSHLSINNTIRHSQIIVDYLEDYFSKYFKVYSEYLTESSFIVPVNFIQIKENLNKRSQNIPIQQYVEFEIGTTHQSKIINIKEYGIICEIDGTTQIGLVHVSDIDDPEFDINYKIGDFIETKIKEFKKDHQKYNLTLVK